MPQHVLAEKYELVREVARGGMGSVWIARDRGLDREVAIKLILTEGIDRAATRERFVREARSLAALSSRHIVRVFDFGVDGESPFLVMELLRGEDLGARLKHRSRLSPAEVASIGAQVGKALTEAHDRGLVHRDLKPGNVFLARVDGEEVVKVLDFGIAKILDAPPNSGDLTRTGAVVGTPHYMSPEQFRASKGVDHRSDLWALGVVLYRCLTGELAFSGDSYGDLVMAISVEPAPVPSQVCPELSPAVDAFFARAFQRDPAARFQSAREMTEAFAAITGASAGAGGGPPSTAETRPSVPLAPSSAAPARPVAAVEADTVHAALAGPVAAATRDGRSRESTPLSLPDRPSIAVLPFQNMSGDPEQDYFADGMVEELVTALSRLRWLFVISRQATQAYKGRAVDVRQAARDLGVRYVLEGSVRKAGQRVRIIAQLAEAGSGAQLWADRFDGALADVFDLQDRITEAVVGAIEPSVRQAEVERARRKHPDNLDAYDLVLRAMPYTDGHSPATSNQALPLLEQALALDPGNALAHAYAAFSLEQRFLRGGLDPADREAALRHAREALANGRDDATALTLGGFVLGIIGGDAEASVTALDQALALNPSSALAYGFSSAIRAFKGDLEIAVEHAQRAVRLSPVGPLRATPFLSIAYTHLFNERYAEAASASEKSALANPRFPVAQTVLAAARQRLGQASLARAAAATLLELEPGFTVPGYERTLASLRVRPEWIATIAAALREAGLPG